jgi:hypothetical protein
VLSTQIKYPTSIILLGARNFNSPQELISTFPSSGCMAALIKHIGFMCGLHAHLADRVHFCPFGLFEAWKWYNSGQSVC